MQIIIDIRAIISTPKCKNMSINELSVECFMIYSNDLLFFLKCKGFHNFFIFFRRHNLHRKLPF